MPVCSSLPINGAGSAIGGSSSYGGGRRGTMRVDRIYRLYREEGLAVRAYADYLTATGHRAPL
jgi:hypothetical protein